VWTVCKPCMRPDAANAPPPQQPPPPATPPPHLEVCKVLADARVAAATKAHVGKGLGAVFLARRHKALGFVLEGPRKDVWQHVVEVGRHRDDVALCVLGGVGVSVVEWSASESEVRGVEPRNRRAIRVQAGRTTRTAGMV
jgi:hypothetical protein